MNNSFHITPVLETDNIVITTDKGKPIPVILIGEKHNFDRTNLTIIENTHSILSIIEKYILYNITNKDARVVLHYESNHLSDMNIYNYIKKLHKFNNIIYNRLIVFTVKLIDILKQLQDYCRKAIKRNNDHSKIDDIKQYPDKLTEVIKIVQKFPENINKYINSIRIAELEDYFEGHTSFDKQDYSKDIKEEIKTIIDTRLEPLLHEIAQNIDTIHTYVDQASYLLNNHVFKYYNECVDYLTNEDKNSDDEDKNSDDEDMGSANEDKNSDDGDMGSDDLELYNISEEEIISRYLKEHNYAFMSKLNLIYAGGWLKSQFKDNKSKYIPYKTDKFKNHLKLVGTVSSIVDNVEIYNIDYRHSIICNLYDTVITLKELHDNDYDTYSKKVFDAVLNLKTIKYSNGIVNNIDKYFIRKDIDKLDNSSIINDIKEQINSCTLQIDNPISVIYNKLCEKDTTFSTRFVDIFSKCIKEYNTSTNIYNHFKKHNRDTRAVCCMTIVFYWILDLYSLLQFIYLSLDKPPTMFITVLGEMHRMFQSLFLKYWYDTNYVKYQYDKKVYYPQFILTELLQLNAPPKEENIITYLQASLSNFKTRTLDCGTFRNSLNSYDFFTDYLEEMNNIDKLIIDRQRGFKLDIVGNFKNIIGNDVTLNTYSQEKKDALFKYLETTTDMFDDEKSVVGGSSKQDDLLYRLQADFAKYTMHICGYDDPVKFMMAINRFLNILNKVQKKNEQLTAPKVSAIGYPISPESRVIKKFRIDPSLDSHKDSLYGGGISFILRVLLISATLVALILLLCWMLVANRSMHAVGQSSRRYLYDYLLDNNYLP